MRSRGYQAILMAGSLVIAWPVRAAEPKPVIGRFGFNTAGMDRSLAPGDDFLGFACGTYLRELAIPPDRSSISVHDRLFELSQARTRQILEAAAAAKDPVPGSDAQKLGAFYGSLMDEAGIEAKGLAPLRPHLEAIAAISDRTRLARALGRANRLGIRVPVALEVDEGNVDLQNLVAGQSGLGLPDRAYYLDLDNAAFSKAREAYRTCIAALLGLAGFSDPGARANTILALETKLAAAQESPAELRQPEGRSRAARFEELGQTCPGLDWAELAAGAGIGNPGKRPVLCRKAIQATAQFIGSEPLADWKDYLAFHTLHAAAPNLPRRFAEAAFAFNGAGLAGQTRPVPRWQFGLRRTTEALPDAVGKTYVAEFCPPKTKALAEQMVAQLVAAMDERLAKLTWLDPWTRTRARSKLASLTTRVGYPEVWRDYSRLEVRPGDALGNQFRAAEFRFQRQLDKLDKLPDRTEWNMPATSVNAYANPLWNEISIAAGVLQPPYFDPAADPAVNYGALGAIIGHEICHHFDDRGRKFDAAGYFLNWWTRDDISRFNAFSDKVVSQYQAYEPLPGVHVDGTRTLGENIADLAGLALAYDAYHRSLGADPAPVLEGFTGDQRFFLAFAQAWAGRIRPEALARQLATDTHTPAAFRVRVVRNLDTWYQAFQVQPGEALYLPPAERLSFW